MMQSLQVWFILVGGHLTFVGDFVNKYPARPIQYVPSRSLRSASLSLLHVPRSNQKTYGDRAFAVAAPRLWNALPIQMRQPGTALDTFKRSLKTLLFKQAFYRFL